MSWTPPPITPKKDYTLKDAMFVVEATNFEYRCLWERNDRLKLALWKEVVSGCVHHVGTLASNPVSMSVRFAILDGCLVAFYEASSRVVDYRMMEEWLRKESPAYASGQKCDAANFHNCLLAIVEKKKIDQPAVQG